MLTGVPIKTPFAVQTSHNHTGGQGVNPFAVAQQKKSSADTEDKLEFKLRVEEDDHASKDVAQQEHLIDMLKSRLLGAKLPDEASPGEIIVQENWITGDIMIYRKDALNDIGFAFCTDGSVIRHHPSSVVSRSAVLPAGTFEFSWVQQVYAHKTNPSMAPLAS